MHDPTHDTYVTAIEGFLVVSTLPLVDKNHEVLQQVPIGTGVIETRDDGCYYALTESVICVLKASATIVSKVIRDTYAQVRADQEKAMAAQERAQKEQERLLQQLAKRDSGGLVTPFTR